MRAIAKEWRWREGCRAGATMRQTVLGLLVVGSLVTALGGCVMAPADDGDESVGEAQDALNYTSGVNGGACYKSAYNCKLRVSGGNRILHVDGDDTWAVDPGQTVLDGNGAALGVNSASQLKFNYGQMRTFNGESYVFAMSTSTASSGWFPLAGVVSGDVLEQRVGHVSAHQSGLGHMSCYVVKDSTDDTLARKKVVYDSSSSPGPSGEAAGDYLAKVRANGLRSINLVFNTPGYALGGVAVDHFPAGTKFQRVDVPTDSGAPSVDVPLWEQASNGHFTKAAGSLKFIYGYVIAATGTLRAGWMAYPALTPSSGCP
jgi:hypothetical protein